MTMKIVTSAVFAGFAAGLIAALLQLWFVQPVLLTAEMYEQGLLSHFASEPEAFPDQSVVFDPLRDVLSILFAGLTYTGYALVLVSAMALAEMNGRSITVRSGLIWGISGFIAVQIAPAFGLPPAVPGNAAADVALRQLWWFPTVAATAVGLWYIAFGTNIFHWLGAAALILLPHLIGAPLPAELTGPTPPEISAQFAGRAMGVGLVTWSVLGLVAAHFWTRSQDAGA